MDGEIFNSWFGINPSFLAHDCRSQQHTRILASSVIDSFKPSCDSDYTASQQTLEDSRAQLWAFPSPPNVFPLKVIAWNPKVSHHWYINDFYNSKSSKYPSSELQICIFNGHFESFLGGLIVIENCNMSKKTSNLYPSPPPVFGMLVHCSTTHSTAQASYLNVCLNYSLPFSHHIQHASKSYWLLIQNTSRICSLLYTANAPVQAHHQLLYGPLYWSSQLNSLLLSWLSKISCLAQQVQWSFENKTVFDQIQRPFIIKAMKN